MAATAERRSADEQVQPGSPAEWHERIRAKEAGFRVWLEDQPGRIGTLRHLDRVLSQRKRVCHLVDHDFQTYEEWFSTFWEQYWDMIPEQQRRELELRNRVIQAQNAQEYRDGWAGGRSGKDCAAIGRRQTG